MTGARALVRVTTAAESAALDAATIAAGVPARALMQRAGSAAAAEIAHRYRALLRTPVGIFAGPGNNGGDAWVVARALAATGVEVRVASFGDGSTPDARAERTLALATPFVEEGSAGDLPLIIDGLLGTGARGPLRGRIADAVASIRRARAHGATIVALDTPTGVDAESGACATPVEADLTITFGSCKQGLLRARGAAGRIIVLDIGLAGAGTEAAARLVDAHWVHGVVPPFAADAHKGTRRKLVIAGGQPGMAGAVVLAVRAAARTGIGMVRALVAPESLPVVQSAAPQALAGVWPEDGTDLEATLTGWADALLIGPGLGHAPGRRALVERFLDAWRGPVVLDADALNVFAGEPDALGALLGARPALLTPHVVELARLVGAKPADLERERFDAATPAARATGAAIVLKGVPTVVTSPAGERLVSAAGTPALATAGSGDLLGGIAATLLAQMGDPLRAGAAAAWVHGRAAERAGARRALRGITLDDIERALTAVWAEGTHLAPRRAPVLAELPDVAAR